MRSNQAITVYTSMYISKNRGGAQTFLCLNFFFASIVKQKTKLVTTSGINMAGAEAMFSIKIKSKKKEKEEKIKYLVACH